MEMDVIKHVRLKNNLLAVELLLYVKRCVAMEYGMSRQQGKSVMMEISKMMMDAPMNVRWISNTGLVKV